ncbi:MAG TPA: hypothetical protein PL110_09040 [Candidatus Eremiobacteraeota bacterium]|nr:hypothetical protein [Candidatus Eremiobacteraeota bacterium]
MFFGYFFTCCGTKALSKHLIVSSELENFLYIPPFKTSISPVLRRDGVKFSTPLLYSLKVSIAIL